MYPVYHIVLFYYVQQKIILWIPLLFIPWNITLNIVQHNRMVLDNAICMECHFR